MFDSVDRSQEAQDSGSRAPRMRGRGAEEGSWNPCPLRDAVADVIDLDTDACPDGQLRDALRDLRQPIAQLQAFVTQVAGILEQRAVAAAPEGRGARAVQGPRDFLTEELGMSRSEAKRAGETGRRLTEAPKTAEAFRAGDLRPDHARIITDLLLQIPAGRRDEVEAELVALARKSDPVTFGRDARRILGRENHDSLLRREKREHIRRSVRIGPTPDGGVTITGQLYGLMGERALTAIQAYTTYDGPDDRRSSEQRTADALDSIFEVALRVGEAPTQHGIRPHVRVHVQWSDLFSGAGTAELAGLGPITIDELRPLLEDCTVSRIVIGPDSVPIEVGEAVRTVPAGLWRALEAREGGCTWPGCHAPAIWCDVAHGHKPFAGGGRLSLDNATLLCRRHHRQFDRGGWRIRIAGRQVLFDRVDQAPPEGIDRDAHPPGLFDGQDPGLPRGP